MTAAHFTVAFHIGVHKTATSHLQRSFQRHVEPLAEAGVRYYGPDHFRLPGRSIPRLFGLKSAKPPRRGPREQIELMCKGAHRVILSEENFIGPLYSPRLRVVQSRYPHAAQRVAALAAAMDIGGVDLFVAVRQPTNYLNSTYCQMLLAGNVVPWGRFQQLHPIESINWVTLIEGLRAATGVNRLTVWRYEDYGAMFDQISAGMTGNTHTNLVTPLPRRIYVSLSAAAVAQLQVLSTQPKKVVEQAAHTAKETNPVSDTCPSFDGFDADQHIQAAAVYDAQINHIADMDGVTLLRP